MIRAPDHEITGSKKTKNNTQNNHTVDGRSVNCRANLAPAVIKKSNISEEVRCLPRQNTLAASKLLAFHFQSNFQIHCIMPDVDKCVYLLICVSILMKNQ